MSSTSSPAPSDCGSVGLIASSCSCSAHSQHTNGGYLRNTTIKYSNTDNIALIIPQSSPTRRRPEEAILMDDLRRAREEMRSLREELRKMREERDKWKNQNHDIPAGCYRIIKEHGLEFDLSLTMLQYLDTSAAVKRLEVHDQHMQEVFARDTCDLAVAIQNIVHEIKFVKQNMGGDTLRWRLCSSLNLMQHISQGLQKDLSRKSQPSNNDNNNKPNHPEMTCDDCLKSTLKSADVQLLSTLNEVRERGMDDYYQAFCKYFAPEYDLVHKKFAVEFYEKTKALMTHMQSQRRSIVVPQASISIEIPRVKTGEEEAVKTSWI